MLNRLTIFLSGAISVVALGVISNVLLLNDGVEQFRDDPLTYRVAQESLPMAWAYRDNPIQRFLTPWASVRDVEPTVRSRTDADARTRRYLVARVRFFSLFGLPAGDIYVTFHGATNRPVRKMAEVR